MIDQIGLAVCGLTALWLSQDPHASVRRFACLAGLTGQPFWFYAAWQSGQVGVLALTMAYTVGWLRGVYTHWIAPRVATNHQRARSRCVTAMVVGCALASAALASALFCVIVVAVCAAFGVTLEAHP